MSTAENGNTVSVHYRGTFDDGTVFDSSFDRGDAITFQLGSGQIIPGFNDAVVGMAPGDAKKISLSPEEAYGPMVEEAVQTVPTSAFPDGMDLTEGLQVQGQAPNGQSMVGTIQSCDGENVIVDFNHPMAGKNLNFHIELLNITG